MGLGVRRRGALGNGSNGDRVTPVQVSGLAGITAIAGGLFHSLALRADGTAWAWGRDDVGELGNGAPASSTSLPVQVALTGIIDIAAGGYHSLAVRADGTTWAWGFNAYGQLGIGTTVDALSPVMVSGLPGMRHVAAGFVHSMSLAADGSAWSWGSSGFGQVGEDRLGRQLVPIRLSLAPMAAIAAGCGYYSMMLDAAGRGFACGRVLEGTLDVGPISTRAFVPERVRGENGVGPLAPITRVSAGAQHSLAIAADGSARAWGFGLLGALGNSWQSTSEASPVHVHALADVVSIAAGGVHSLAVLADGSTWAWGENSRAQVGPNAPGSQVLEPVAVAPMGPASSVAAGGFHSLALLQDGTLRAWGGNDRGQLGMGTTVDTGTPRIVVGVSMATGVAAGGAHSLALLSDGSVRSWGAGDRGQLGDGSSVDRLMAVAVTGLSAMTAVGAGGAHSLALGADGLVRGWGANDRGQLGDGSTTDRATPVVLSGLADVVLIAAGGSHSLAVTSDGRVWSWGAGDDGQLGTGGAIDALVPVRIASLAGVAAVAAGARDSLAVKSDGTTWAWGQGDEGQAGTGRGAVTRARRMRPPCFGNTAPTCDLPATIDAGCSMAALLATVEDDDGDDLGYTWTSDNPLVTLVPASGTSSGRTGAVALSVDASLLPTTAPCALVATLTLDVDDGRGGTTSCSTTITFDDRIAPSLNGFPSDAMAECDAVPAAAPVTAVDDCDPLPTVAFSEAREAGSCPGEYRLRRTWSATDRCGNATTRTQLLSVRDTTPPTLMPDAGGARCIWPPNHAMVRFVHDDIAPIVTDNCSEPVTWRFVGCNSDQPDDAGGPNPSGSFDGDGHTDGDCQVAPDGSWFAVRAERAGAGNDAQAGRHYIVTVRALDACGNESAATPVGVVVVPHDRAGADQACGRAGRTR